MRANELRVNNIVLYNDIEYVISEFCETIILLDNLKPIPLTEEWLIKFGFEQNIIEGLKFREYNKKLKDTYTINTICGGTTMCQLAINGCITQVLFEYVHQLQNLYFALTNEELTYEKL